MIVNRLALFLWSTLLFAQGSPDVVISQVYAGGGNAGAPLGNDFVELYNRGNAAVDLTGWSVQYSSATSTEWLVTFLAGAIQPGRYYLVQEAEGANVAAPALPAPDATGTIAMSGTAAKVRVVRDDGTVVDLVGYGTANMSERAPAPALTNTTAAIRRGNGCIDTDDNSADFQIGAPRPRNSSADSNGSCDAPPVEALPLRISEIQGPGSESPVVGRLVVTRGVVTGRKSNGFFVQSIASDEDREESTSEGVFVFTSTAPAPAAAVGSLVEVRGTVAEFRPASDATSPPLTEIVEPRVSVIATGQPLPTPVALRSVADLETLEGMRVSTTTLTATSPTGGTVNEPSGTASSNGVFYAVEEAALRPFTTSAGTVGPRLLRIDSRALGAPLLDVRSGNRISALTGPLDYGFRRYTVAPEATGLVLSTAASPELLPRNPAREFAVASMNLERLFDTENDPSTSDPIVTPEAYRTRLIRIGRVIREVLQSPEIIGVVEVENLAVLQALAREAGNYDAFLTEGNDPGGIDVGVLVRRDRVRVQSFAQEGKGTRIDTNDVLNDRPPVILRASVGNVPIVVVVNHLRSLINAESPVVARKRRMQAEFLSSLLHRERGENLISVGDYNMTQFDQLMSIITSSGLLNLTDTLRPNESYTYVFEGVTQTLDHMLLSPAMQNFLTRYQVAHINADFPQTARNNTEAMYRISDHDVPLAYFSFEPQSLRAAAVTNAASFTSGSVAPNELITLFTPGPLSNITINGTRPEVLYSIPRQTTITLPATLAGSSVEISIDGATVTVPISNYAPGIFTLPGTGRGQGAILNQDVTVNHILNPAERGSLVTFYATGVDSDAPAVWIGNSRAEIFFSSRAPNVPPGVHQINARIPANAPTGANVPLFVTVGNEVSAAGVTLAIR
jgi:uncharacterized protein (TIGR03437 family)